MRVDSKQTLIAPPPIHPVKPCSLHAPASHAELLTSHPPSSSNWLLKIEQHHKQPAPTSQSHWAFHPSASHITQTVYSCVSKQFQMKIVFAVKWPLALCQRPPLLFYLLKRKLSRECVTLITVRQKEQISFNHVLPRALCH